MSRQYHFQNSVFFRLNIFTILTLIILVVLTIAATREIVRPQLESRFRNMASQAGNTILAEFSKDLYKAKTLSKVLARWAESADKDLALFKRTLPVLIDLKAEENFIAGGGIWPEPNAFDSKIERRSFFWGRNKLGRLEYFDDYNNPEGAGYHNEEWYVPVGLLPRNKVYWSQAYTDPYTKQPMVTCSSPIHIQDKFWGVSTVDIKLDGLQNSIQNIVKKFNGYGFVLDRFNQVVFYSKKIRLPKDESLYSYNEILKVSEHYRPVIDAILSIEKDTDNFTDNQKLLINKNKKYFRKKITGLSDNNITQLSLDLSNKIILENSTRNMLIKQIDIKSDPVLNGSSAALVFHMPETNWKLIFFLPERPIEKAVSEIITDISWFQAMVIIFMFISGAWLMHFLIARPLHQMIFQLKKHSDEDGHSSLLTVNGKGEISELVDAFNNKTKALSSVLSEVSKLEKEQSKRLKEFTQSITDAIIVINTKGEIVFWNKAATDIFGYSVDEVLHQSILCIIPKELHDSHRAGLKHAVLNGEMKHENTILELPAITRDGNRLLVELTLSVSTSNGEKIFTAILRDITERKKAENELKTALRSKTDFLSNMSHELRTPMHAILSYSQFGIKKIDGKNTEKLLKYFNQINFSGKRLLSLLNDLLDMSKLDAGKMELHVEELDFSHLIEKCISEMKSLAEDRFIELHFTNETANSVLNLDGPRISQVIINLISNAIKFSRDHSCIDLRIADMESDEGKSIIFSIHDQGDGIPANELESIFEQFVQSSQTDNGAGGTGLGLAISKEIVSLHSGEIWAENAAEGGAIIYVILPAS